MRKHEIHHPHPIVLYLKYFIVLEVLNHDVKAFTQGLTYYNGYLYEGTGLHGKSKIRKLDPLNPSIILSSSRRLPKKYFGEGITYFQDKDGNDRILQLTWKEKKMFIFDANTLEMVQELTQTNTTTGEGWGITYDGRKKEFIVSDGSNFLHFWDRDTFKEKRKVSVTIENDRGKITTISYLNELEFLQRSKSTILANVWYQDILLEIDPHSGKVERVYNFDTLFQNRNERADSFNGVSISGDEDESIVYVSGKQWSHLFKVKLL